MIGALKLPFAFDSARLHEDLARIAPDEWVPHFNTAYYEGEWSGVSLRSIGGKPCQLYPDPNASGAFAPTATLERCPYFQEVLGQFTCPMDSARLLKLRAGSSIREHRDFRLGYEDGEVRIHVPIVTDEAVFFVLNGERIPMLSGEAWYLNVNMPHRVENRSAIDRVHLVFDCLLDDWLDAFFPAEDRAERLKSLAGGFIV